MAELYVDWFPSPWSNDGEHASCDAMNALGIKHKKVYNKIPWSIVQIYLHIDRLVQERHDPSALAMDLPFFLH